MCPGDPLRQKHWGQAVAEAERYDAGDNAQNLCHKCRRSATSLSCLLGDPNLPALTQPNETLANQRASAPPGAKRKRPQLNDLYLGWCHAAAAFGGGWAFSGGGAHDGKARGALAEVTRDDAGNNAHRLSIWSFMCRGARASHGCLLGELLLLRVHYHVPLRRPAHQHTARHKQTGIALF